MASNIIGLLSQLPANFTWHDARSQIGNPTNAEVSSALQQQGISSAHIAAFLNGKESVSQVLSQTTKLQPPSALEAAGLAGALGLGAAGTLGVGGTSKLLSNLLGKYGGSAGSALIWAPILIWLTTAKNWVRVLEFVGGAAMIGIAMRELAHS